MNKINFEAFEKAFNNTGLQKATLARTVGARPNTLQGWFDRRVVPVKYLHQLAETLKVSPRYLLGETEDETRMQIVPILGKSTATLKSTEYALDHKDQFENIERKYSGKDVYAVYQADLKMSPSIEQDALCLVNPEIKIKSNDIVLYSYGSQHGIARYKLSADKQTIVLAHDNAEYEPIFISWDSDEELIMHKIFRIEQDI